MTKIHFICLFLLLVMFSVNCVRRLNWPPQSEANWPPVLLAKIYQFMYV